MKTVKSLEGELIRTSEEMAKLKNVGSEEYLNAAKAQAQLAEAINKTKNKVDANVIVSTVATIATFVVMLAFNDNHITDTKVFTFTKGLFKK